MSALLSDPAQDETLIQEFLFNIPLRRTGCKIVDTQHQTTDWSMDDLDARIRLKAFDFVEGLSHLYGNALPREALAQECHNRQLVVVPYSPRLRPQADFLEERFELFRKAG